jgi:hypothetical protein
LEEACKTARRELAALEDRAECRRSLKRDQDALLEG